MKNLSHIVFGIALAAPLTLATAVQADNPSPPPSSSSMSGDKQDVTMDQLPKAVKTTVQRESKGKNVESMKKSTKNGAVAFEVKIVDGSKETTLDISNDGKVRDRQVRASGGDTSSRSGDTSKSSDTNKPSDSSRPNDSSRPSDTNKPSDTSKPNDTSEPNDTTQPPRNP
jgi:hypothetical protein